MKADAIGSVKFVRVPSELYTFAETPPLPPTMYTFLEESTETPYATSVLAVSASTYALHVYTFVEGTKVEYTYELKNNVDIL
jgi:hypothetical protein